MQIRGFSTWRSLGSWMWRCFYFNHFFNLLFNLWFSGNCSNFRLNQNFEILKEIIFFHISFCVKFHDWFLRDKYLLVTESFLNYWFICLNRFNFCFSRSNLNCKLHQRLYIIRLIRWIIILTLFNFNQFDNLLFFWMMLIV